MSKGTCDQTIPRTVTTWFNLWVWEWLVCRSPKPERNWNSDQVRHGFTWNPARTNSCVGNCKKWNPSSSRTVAGWWQKDHTTCEHGEPKNEMMLGWQEFVDFRILLAGAFLGFRDLFHVLCSYSGRIWPCWFLTCRRVTNQPSDRDLAWWPLGWENSPSNWGGSPFLSVLEIHF